MRVKNWKRFQHFKDRRPPWIKLYRDLLDDIEYHQLEPRAAKALVMIWLIASEQDGEIPAGKELAFRLRMTEKETNTIISKLYHWITQDDIKMISTRYQDDAPESETETETEREGEQKDTVISSPLTLGQFHNVRLTADELRRLNLKFGPSECDERIERLSTYIASKGKKYRSHYATILSWAQKDQVGTKDPPPQADHRTVCKVCKQPKSPLIDGVCNDCASLQNHPRG